jgi:hypothetical protein
MTPRQIRIACCGMVVSTRPFPDPAYEDDLMQIMREVRELRKNGDKVVVWVNEGSVVHLMGSVG